MSDKSTARKSFNSNEVAEFCGVSLRQLQWWDEHHVVSPKQKDHKRIYMPKELVEISVVAALRSKGVSLQKTRRVIRFLQKQNISEALESRADLHLITDGKATYIEDSPTPHYRSAEERQAPDVPRLHHRPGAAHPGRRGGSMSANSKIEWTSHTFNCWWGCTKVSPECDMCYADTFAKRVGFSETGSQFPIWGKDARRRFFGYKHWDGPLKWNRDAAKAGERRRVFCGSMCDVMEDREDLQASRVRLYNLISDTPNLDWLLLTKRPQNFRRFLPATWLERPRPNVWGMTTVGHPDYLWRVTELVKTPFAIRGLSMEPLLGPISFRWAVWDDHSPNSRREEQLPDVERGGRLLAGTVNHLDGLRMLDLVIVGGESGASARPMHPDWVRSIRDECQEAGVAFFFKQWGEWAPATREHGTVGSMMPETGEKYTWIGGDGSTQNPSSNGLIDPVMAIARVGKKAAGRLLDGREWNEMPEARA